LGLVRLALYLETLMPETVEGKLIHWRKVTQSWFHSRKALLLLVVLTLGSVALFVGKLDGGQWLNLVKWAVPAYMAANVGDSIATAFGGKSDDSAS